MKFSPEGTTFDDIIVMANNALNPFHFFSEVEYRVEDCVPWINITGNRVIKPKEALKILESLQKNIVDEILFNSLSGREMRIVINGKFHFTPEESRYDFDDDYAHDFGITIEEMKEEYELT